MTNDNFMRKMTILFVAVFAVASAGHDWGYDDFVVWDRISECSTGKKQQSPINIDTTNSNPACASQDDLNVLKWRITRGEKTFNLVSNEHSVYIKNPKDGFQSEITYADGSVYCFDSFHFHWSTNDDTSGSEHSIDNKFYSFEAHMVHYYCKNINGATKYVNGSDAAHHFAANQLVDNNDFVFAAADLYFDALPNGPLYPGLNTLINGDVDISDKNHVHGADYPEITIDISTFVPETRSTQEYFTYKGSLTTPPCSTTVKFIAFPPQNINAQQLHAFETKADIAKNYRSIQNQLSSTNVYQCSTYVV